MPPVLRARPPSLAGNQRSFSCAASAGRSHSPSPSLPPSLLAACLPLPLARSRSRVPCSWSGALGPELRDRQPRGCAAPRAAPPWPACSFGRCTPSGPPAVSGPIGRRARVRGGGRGADVLAVQEEVEQHRPVHVPRPAGVDAQRHEQLAHRPRPPRLYSPGRRGSGRTGRRRCRRGLPRRRWGRVDDRGRALAWRGTPFRVCVVVVVVVVVVGGRAGVRAPACVQVSVRVGA